MLHTTLFGKQSERDTNNFFEQASRIFRQLKAGRVECTRTYMSTYTLTFMYILASILMYTHVYTTYKYTHIYSLSDTHICDSK